MKNEFSLRTPCSECPFRRGGGKIELSPGRREEIIGGLLSGSDTTFPCHMSVYSHADENFDDEGNYTPGGKVKVCAGAASVTRKFGRDTVFVQIAQRMNVIPLDHYDKAEKLTMEPAELDLDPAQFFLTS